MEKKVTILDVANHTGLSRATISRVLNKDPHVRKITETAVQQAMEELGYVPNQMARGLSAGRTRSIALVIPDVSRSFYSLLVEGAEEAAIERSYHIYLKTLKYPKAVLSLWEERRVDGFIVRHARDPDVSFLKKLKRSQVPVVVIGKPIEDFDFPSILVDNVGGARQVAHHFVSHGFKRILVISGTPGRLDSDDRVYGFLVGMKEKGFDANMIDIRTGDFSKESGYEAVSAYFVDHQADAVFAANDSMALGALLYFNERSIRVPEDIALAGFDDTFFAEYLWPPLTTVRQPMYEMGAAAMRTILSCIEGHGSRQTNLILPAELIVRRSCGCSAGIH